MKKFVARFGIFILNLLSLAIVGIVGVLAYVNSTIHTKPSDFTNSSLSQPLQVVDSQGQLLATYGDVRRVPLMTANIPDVIKETIYQVTNPHDVNGQLVPVVDLFHKQTIIAPTGHISTYGPGLSQRLAIIDYNKDRLNHIRIRNKYFVLARNILLGFKVRNVLSNEEIITSYMNLVYMGNKAYGFEAAAKTYFAKTLSQLDNSEQATLVAISQDPEKYNPFDDLQATTKQRNIILRVMQQHGIINQVQLRQALAEPLELHSGYKDYAKTYATEIAREALFKAKGEQAYTEGYKIQLTINDRDQRFADLTLRSSLLRQELRGRFKGVVTRIWSDDQAPKPDMRIIEATLRNTPSYAPLFPVAVIKVNSDSITVINNRNTQLILPKEALNWALTTYSETNNDTASNNILGATSHSSALLLGLGQSSIILKPSDKPDRNKLELPTVEQHEPYLISKVFKVGDIFYLAVKESSPHYKSFIDLSDFDENSNGFDSLKDVTLADLTLAQIPAANIHGAFVSLDATTGAIQAFSGGFAYHAHSPNYAIMADNQVGSIIKPLVYTYALEKGLTVASIQEDKVASITNPDNKVVSKVENYNQKYSGLVTLRKALAENSNTVPLRVLNDSSHGLSTVEFFGFLNQHFVFKVANNVIDTYLPLGKFRASPLEMARAYAVFNNGGFLINPYLIAKITKYEETNPYYVADMPKVCTDCNVPNVFGKGVKNAIGQVGQSAIIHDAVNSTIWDLPRVSDSIKDKNYAPRVIDKEVAYLVNDMLHTNVTGGLKFTGNASYLNSLRKQFKRDDIAGMVGPGFDENSVWFAGEAAKYTGVTYNTLQRVTLADQTSSSDDDLLAWYDYNRFLLADTPKYQLVKPQNIVSVKIDLSNGLLNNRGVSELFINGTQPTRSAYIKPKPKYVVKEEVVVTKRKVYRRPTVKAPPPKPVDPLKAKQYKSDGSFNDDEFNFYGD